MKKINTKNKIHKHIKKHAKNYFVPHTQNNYHPHIFRNASLIGLFSICIFLLGLSLGNFIFLDKTVLGANIATNVLVDMANVARQASSTPVLSRSKKLDMAASLKAEDMITNKYFAHFSPDGTTPWYFMREAGYNFVYAGENLAINFFDSIDVQKAWMNSPTHRANLLNSKFKEIGISTKEGFYKGANSIYIVQMFGTEAPPKLESVFGDYKKENDAKKKVVEDTRLSKEGGVEKFNKNIIQDAKVEVVVESKNFLSFKNTEYENVGTKIAGVETYSTWWERIVFDGSWYIQIIFFVIIGVITIAFLIRMFIEYERQHHKHILYSLLALILVLFLAYINYYFVIQHL